MKKEILVSIKMKQIKTIKWYFILLSIIFVMVSSCEKENELDIYNICWLVKGDFEGNYCSEGITKYEIEYNESYQITYRKDSYHDGFKSVHKEYDDKGRIITYHYIDYHPFGFQWEENNQYFYESDTLTEVQ